MHFIRQWKEDKDQGVDERIIYTLDTLPWGGNPSAVVVEVKEGGVVVTNTVVTGAASVDTHTITLPVIHSLAAGKRYRVETKWTSSGNTFECYGFINADQ